MQTMLGRTPSLTWRDAKAWLCLAGVAAAYYGLARLGLLFSLPNSLASPIWPPTGLAIAAVALWRWPAAAGVLVGAVAAESAGTGSLVAGLGLGIGNTLEALAGGLLLARIGGPRALQRVGGIGRFLLYAALAPLASVAFGIGTLVATGNLATGAAAGSAWTWYLGDLAGAVVVAPPLLLATQARWPRESPGRALEPLAAGAVLLGLSMLLFGLVPGVPGNWPGRLLLLMPALVWAATRLDPAFATAFLAGVDALAVAATKQGLGPFSVSAPATAFLQLQAFILTAAAIVLTLSALRAERRRDASDLEGLVANRTAELHGEVEERRRAEAQAHAERERFAALLESAPDAMVIVDAAGRIVLVNGQVERLFGYARAELLGQPVERLIPESARDRHAGHRAAFAEHPQPRPMGMGIDLRGRRKDGTVFPVEVSLSPLKTAGGVLVSSAIRDVSERRRDEAALRESLERFRVLAEGSPLGVFHTGRQGTVDYANPRWMEIAGVADFHDFAAIRAAVHPDDVDRLTQAWRAAVASGTDLVAEFRYVHRDGKAVQCTTRASPVRDESGAITGFVGTLDDVTERRALEAREREIDRLREQARFKTEFLRTAAHELGNPLTPIKIQLRMLKQFVAQPDHAEAGRNVDILDRNVERLHLLVRDMLESARLQAGRMRLLPRAMDLSHVLHEVAETFQEAAIQNGIALEVATPPRLPLVADPDRLTQIFYNLLSNAMKFTPAGGRIHVEVQGAGGWATVTVADTGAGFTADQAGGLFQPFGQVHDAVPGKGGTGLGLYISKGIAQQHGGTLEACSDGPGKGSTFTVRVPLVAVQQPAEVLDAAEAQLPR